MEVYIFLMIGNYGREIQNGAIRLNGPIPQRASKELSLGMESFIDIGPELSCSRRIITYWKDGNYADNEA
jgi:hypothetical protein